VTTLLFIKGGSPIDNTLSMLSAAHGVQLYDTMVAHEGFTPDPLWDQVAFCERLSDAQALADAARRAGAETILFFEVNRHAIIDGPAEGVHLITLIRRKADITNAQFCDHYLNTHARLVLQNGGFQSSTSRYSQFHVRPETIHAEGDIVPYDGIAEFWFHSIDQAMTTWAAQEYLAVLRPDEKLFMLNPPNHRLMLKLRGRSKA